MKIGINKLDWIKIDVEGAEERVLRGAQKILSCFSPKLIIECHLFLDPESINKVKSILSASRSFSFQEFDHPSENPCSMLVATPI